MWDVWKIQDFLEGMQNISLKAEGIWDNQRKDKETNSNEIHNRLSLKLVNKNK